MIIVSRKDLESYINTERDFISGRGSLKNLFMPPLNIKFVKSLRTLEYHYNNKGIYHRLMTLYSYMRYCRLMSISGIQIPKNVCGKGLTLYHWGSIVVNPACRIGENCCIMNNVNIGANQGSSAAPHIGRDVYIGPGAVIFGDITIADGVYIGANAVVNKSILEPGAVVVGIPAKIIKTDNVHWWQKNGLER